MLKSKPLKSRPPKRNLTKEDYKRLREATMRRFAKTIAYLAKH